MLSDQRDMYEWLAQIGNELVFVAPDNVAGRQLQANALEQLGYQSENATWRNIYLTGAQELRLGRSKVGITTTSPEMVRTLTIPDFFDYMAVRLDGDKAAGKTFTVNCSFTDISQRYAMTLRNSALTYQSDTLHLRPTASIKLIKAILDRISLREMTMAQALCDGSIQISGDATAVSSLFGMLDTFDPTFSIVTPPGTP